MIAMRMPTGLAWLRGSSPGLRSSGRGRPVWTRGRRAGAGFACAFGLGWAPGFALAPLIMSCASTTAFASASPRRIASRSFLIASILLPRFRASMTSGGSELRSAMIRILSLAALAACTAVAADPPWRRQPEIERIGVGCPPNPTDLRIASRAELDRLLGAWNKECTFPEDRQRAALFAGAIEKANIDFSREALFILRGYYRTGMARASLDLRDEGRVVNAAVAWRVPKPPLTPDTATYRYAFTVDKARASHVRVTVDGRETAMFATQPENR